MMLIVTETIIINYDYDVASADFQLSFRQTNENGSEKFWKKKIHDVTAASDDGRHKSDINTLAPLK